MTGKHDATAAADGTPDSDTYDTDVVAVERAMVAIRRSQTRRSLARLAGVTGAVGVPGSPGDPSPGGGGAAGGDSGDSGEPKEGKEADTPPGTPLLDVLDVIEAAERTGGTATVSSLVAALRVDQPRASRLAAAAVEAGLVRREADQADGRRALLVATAAGRALLDQVHRSRQAVFADVMADWPQADRAAFARLLTRFTDGLAARTR